MNLNPLDFKSTSDTEVLLELISKKGLINTLKVVNGNFAFAIWDNIKKKVFLVRDRVGVKPLYYKLDSEKLIFSSEQNSINVFFFGYVGDPS